MFYRSINVSVTGHLSRYQARGRGHAPRTLFESDMANAFDCAICLECVPASRGLTLCGSGHVFCDDCAW